MVSPSARVSIRSAFAVAALLLCALPIPSRAEEGATRAADAEEGPSFVLTLDSANFSDAIKKHAFIVVEFYAPWCGHCKNLAPEYEKAASFLSKHDLPIFLAKVDANDQANKEIASMYDVKGYPTIKIFRNGGKNIQEYKGPRDADGIVRYLKKQAGPSSGELKSSDDVASLFDDKKVYIVGVFSEFSGEEFENYKIVADKMRSDYDFGHTVDAKLLPRGESTVKPPFVRLFKPFDELSVDSQDFNVDALEKFIEMSSVPLVTIFSKNPDHRPFIQKFFGNDNDKALLFTNFSSDSFEAFESVYHDVARSLKERKISFLLGDVDVSQGALQYYGLKGNQLPLIIVNKNEGQKYLKANIDPTQVAAWIKDALDGNVEQYIKSEPIPEANNEPVKVVVADSLHDLVFSSGKNVLLEFYAPWCGHCKKLAPILEEVAVSLQNDADVIIAKMELLAHCTFTDDALSALGFGCLLSDFPLISNLRQDATANDFPSEFEVRAYPTLYLRTASGNTVKYDGDRTKRDLISFIQGNKDSPAEARPSKDEL